MIGTNEFDIFKNYYTEQKSEYYRYKISTLSLKSKDNAVAEHLRKLADADFAVGKYFDCLTKYTESLGEAICNGREYAMALANRSATYFAMKKYKNCLIDINLSLQADCPGNLKPQMLLRKAMCFINMGNFKKMVETVDDCYYQMENDSNLAKTDKDNYMTQIKSMMNIKQVDIEEFALEDTILAPEVIVKENRRNPNVSASVKLKCNGKTQTDFIAVCDIPCGEVLFVDPAYSIGYIKDYEEECSSRTFVCDFCWKEAKNCIPCTFCVNFMYCSEECLCDSWTEYHQWECPMFRSKFLPGGLCLPLRTLIKAAFSGAIFQITKNSKLCKPSKDVNPYLSIYGLHVDFAYLRSKSTTMFFNCCEQAVLIVEFLKTSNFFHRLILTSSCQKDYPTLVNFVGGLLIRHIIQLYQRSLSTSYASSAISVLNEDQGELEFLLTRSKNFFAFCPTVSRIKYSCESNTSMYFHGNTCIVKASKIIKAGNHIVRSGFNLTPMVPFSVRQAQLAVFGIHCDCTACKDISNNIDIMNTWLCTECGKFTVLHLMPSNFMFCHNCQRNTSVEAFQKLFGSSLLDTIGKENFPTISSTTENMLKTLPGLNTFKKIANPNHKYLYNHFKDFLLMYSKEENFTKFTEALRNFKVCAKNRSGRFDSFEYVNDLSIICKACFAYLQVNKPNLEKKETTDILSYFSDVIKEAKEIAEFTFPPLLRLFGPIELYILTLRVTDVYLQDV